MNSRRRSWIHATLHRHGLICEESDLFGKKGMVWLEALVADPASGLRESGRTTLRGYLDLLAEVRKRVAQATRQFRTIMRREVPGRRLMTLPGVSSILGYTILAEVGKIERFKDGRVQNIFNRRSQMRTAKPT